MKVRYIEFFEIANIEQYALNNGYQVQMIKENQYLFEKENQEEIDKFNYFSMKNDRLKYRIHLIARKTLLNEKEIKKVVSEYDRMVKSSRLKEI